MAIGAGSGFINDPSHKLEEINWGAQTVNLTNPGDNFIYIDVNGNPYITSTRSNPDNYIYLGYAYTINGNSDIGLISSNPFYAGNYSNRNNNYLSKVVGVMVESGNIVSEDSTPLHLSVNSGVINSNLSEYNTGDTTIITK